MKVVIFNQKINLLFLIYVLTVSCKFFEVSKLKIDSSIEKIVLGYGGYIDVDVRVSLCR